MSARQLEQRDALTLAGGSVNEDRAGVAFFATAASAWVIDGATGVAEREYIPAGPTDAAWLAERLDWHFARRDPARVAVPAYFGDIIAAIADEYTAAVPEAATLPSYALPSAAAIWAAVDGNLLTFAWQGDCRAIVSAGDAVSVINAGEDAPWQDGIEDLVRRQVAASSEPIGKLIDLLVEPLREQRSRLNRPDGYWMLGIAPEAARHLDQRTITLNGPASVLLASDGLWRLVDHFRVYDAAGLLEAAATRGLAFLGDELRVLERADPECRRVPRVKPYDDATGLLLTIDPSLSSQMAARGA